MGLWEAPQVTKNMDIDQLKNLVQMLIDDLEFVINGNLNSKNVREIGGYLVGQDYLRSKNGLVGLSSAVLGGDDIRMWAGDIDPSSAPFRVYNSGHLYGDDVDLSGSIKLKAGSTISWTDVTPPTPADVGALPFDDPKLSQLNSVGAYLGALNESQVSGLTAKTANLNSIGDYIGALSQGQVSGLSTRLTNITSTGVYTGTLGADKLVIGEGGALIDNALIGNLSADKITSGTLSTVTIDVNTNARVGNNLYVGDFSDSGERAMYLKTTNYLYTIGDSLGITSMANIHLNPGGNVFINGVQLDPNPVATFG